MTSVRIPTLIEAQDLRALFWGNPVIDAAEQALRAYADRPDMLQLRDAVTLLDAWHFLPELSIRERAAVLARFMPDPARRCARCKDWIEYVTDGPDPGWWRHTEGVTLDPHGAVPLYATREMTR